MTEDAGHRRPYGFFALAAGDVAELRARRASGTDADVLAWARQLAGGPADRVAGDDWTWEPLRRCLAGRYQLGQGEPVFGRRDHDLRLLDAGQVAGAATALAGAERDWLRERFERLPRPEFSDPLVESPLLLRNPEPVPGDALDFDATWDSLTRLMAFFARASVAGAEVLYFTSSRFWRPARVEAGPDGAPRVVRPPYRPEDYRVDPNSIRSLPKNGGSWPFDAELDERDGALYSWTEVGRFIRGGRTWVRLTRSDFEYYIDVENADDRIGRIECVDPLIAYWQARRADQYPVRLED
jgi:hypothetical protein